MDRAAIIEYIRQAAIARNMDPDIAVRVAESEGLNANPEEGWQSQIVKNGVREESYGPFQLYMGGGLGNVFMERTGLDPRDPATVTQQIDFALDEAARGGWGPWYGAARVGIGEREGIPDPGRPRPRPDRTAAEALVNGDDLQDDLLSRIRPQPRPDREQAEDKSFLDRLPDALQYLDVSQLAQAPRYRFDPPAIRRGQGGSGAQALQRLGIASLV
jgi:hypothetical protein